MKRLSNPVIIALICITVFAFNAGLYAAGAFKVLENIVYDNAAKIVRIDKSISDDIAIVLIDEASLSALNPVVGRWPWPRAIYSDLLEFFKMANPKAVLFDILFTETQGKLGDQLDPNDEALVLATGEAGFAYHAFQLIKDEEDEHNKSLLDKPLPEDFMESFALKLPAGHLEVKSENNNYYIPYPELYRVSVGMGVVEFSPDSDGVFRRTKPVRAYQGTLFPVMGLAPFFENAEIVAHPRELIIDGKKLELDEKGNYIINVYGKFNTYSISGIFSSLQNIMAGELENLIVDPMEFENKIVFVGSSAVGVEDLKTTPISPRTPGAFLHASLASNFILDDFLSPVGGRTTIVIMLIFILATVPTVFYVNRYSVKYTIPIALLVIWFLFYFQRYGGNVLYEAVPPASAIFFSAIFSFGYLLMTEGRDKRKVKKMFSQFVSEDVLSTLMENYEKYGSILTGANEDITILFTDIRGFTSFSDDKSPETVVKMLNCYFSNMTEIIFEGGGTVDKFIGDAIMAFWGAPTKMKNHAEKGVLTAIKMINALESINEELKSIGIDHEIKIGIGLNTGNAIIGNIGSEKHLSYTAIGDTINLSARLESMTKVLGATIVISEFTYNRLNIDIPCRPIDKVEVRGKKDKIQIYEVLCYDDEESCKHAQEVAYKTKMAYKSYEEGDYKTALELYGKIDDGPLKENFLKKCEEKLK